MKLENAVVFVTGANRGLGLEFVRQLLDRGARKVYAAARKPEAINLPGVVPVTLDVTDPQQIIDAAGACEDVTVLINNAGIADFGGFLTPDSVESARRHLETNFFGPMMLTRAFAPILAANGGGAVLNVLSIASWLNGPLLGVYAASKSAAWALTNGLRIELADQGTLVTGLHMGFVDTDLTRDLDVPKANPAEIITQALDGLEAGTQEVLADDMTRQVKQGLSAEQASYLSYERSA